MKSPFLLHEFTIFGCINPAFSLPLQARILGAQLGGGAQVAMRSRSIVTVGVVSLLSLGFGVLCFAAWRKRFQEW